MGLDEDPTLGLLARATQRGGQNQNGTLRALPTVKTHHGGHEDSVVRLFSFGGHGARSETQPATMNLRAPQRNWAKVAVSLRGNEKFSCRRGEGAAARSREALAWSGGQSTSKPECYEREFVDGELKELRPTLHISKKPRLSAMVTA
jgi:hypothetical protein